MSSQALVSGHGSPLIIVDGADFDGTNDYMTRGAGLTGAADSKSGIFVCYLRKDAGDGSAQRIFGSSLSVGGSVARTRVQIDTNNSVNVQGDNSGGSAILRLTSSTNSVVVSASYICIMASWDLATPGAHNLYIQDVSDKTVSIFTDDTIDYTSEDHSIGANPNGTNKLNGCLSELYFAPGQYLDFSIVANRRKFISATGKPVYLGTTGSVPTGTAPIVYQHLDDAEAVANFATNRGTGGNFTITGTLETASSSPSD